MRPRGRGLPRSGGVDLPEGVGGEARGRHVHQPAGQGEGEDARDHERGQIGKHDLLLVARNIALAGGGDNPPCRMEGDRHEDMDEAEAAGGLDEDGAIASSVTRTFNGHAAARIEYDVLGRLNKDREHLARLAGFCRAGFEDVFDALGNAFERLVRDIPAVGDQDIRVLKPVHGAFDIQFSRHGRLPLFILYIELVHKALSVKGQAA